MVCIINNTIIANGHLSFAYLCLEILEEIYTLELIILYY